MPTIEKIWEKKNGYTKSASELSRSLCFAGLAVVWIFRVPNGEYSAIPGPLMWCAFGFALALALDLLQYFVGASRTKAFGNSIEKEIEAQEAAGTPVDRDTKQFLYPDSHRTAMERFWVAKVSVTAVFWLLLLWYVLNEALHAGLPKLT
jgi:hypothetical protein